MVMYIGGGILALIAIMLIAYYNKFVRMKNLTEEAWSGIDVQLKKRYNLIPNLVNAVKGYATHEKEVFENVAAMRSTGINAQTVKDQIAAENMITQALGKLFAVAENYPDLKANTNFLQLQSELADIEDDIEKSRRYYNGAARENNIAIQSFPGNLVAASFGFGKYEYFEIENPKSREVPEVKF